MFLIILIVHILANNLKQRIQSDQIQTISTMFQRSVQLILQPYNERSMYIDCSQCKCLSDNVAFNIIQCDNFNDFTSIKIQVRSKFPNLKIYQNQIQHSYIETDDKQRLLQNQSVVDEPNTLFKVHAIVFYILWGFIVDIGIIISRHLKTNNNYIKIHTLIFIVVDFATLIIIIICLTSDFDAGGVNSNVGLAHKVMALIFLLILVIQHILGIVTRHNTEAYVKENKEFLKIVRGVHMLIGMSLYVISKLIILLGLIAKQDSTSIIIASIWVAVLLSIQIIFERRKRKGKLITQVVQPQLTQALTADQKQILELLDKGVPTETIIQQYPTIIWVLMGTDVYDLTDYMHPAGNFMIAYCQGREISRFFYGAYGIESTNIKKHKHSATALQSLVQRYIGTIQPSLIATQISKSQDKRWVIESKEQITKQITQFNYTKQGIKLSLNQNVQDFGQHFNVSFQEVGGKVRMYTKIMAMNKGYQNYRQEALNFFDLFEQGKIQNCPVLQNQFAQSLPLIIKRYDYPKALTVEIFNSNDPIFIDGPIGRGLELDINNYQCAFTGGTGILPFIDLLDHLLFKSIYTVIAKQNQQLASQFFNKNDQLEGNFQFKLCSAFQSEKEFIGGDWIRRLYEINKKHNLKLFDMEVKYSNKVKDPIIPTIQDRFDQQYINSQIKDGKTQVSICGPPEMNRLILNILSQSNQDQGKIRII